MISNKVEQAQTILTGEPIPARIEIKPFPDERGRKAVYVNGEMWGTIHMHQHGGRGNSFTFRQAEGSTVEVPSYIDHRGDQKYKDFSVAGDRLARRQLAPTDPPPAPIEERLLEAARDLVAKKLLRDPAEVRAERERKHKEWQTAQLQAADEESHKFETKADDVLKPFVSLSPEYRSALRTAIVDAMRWAQSQ